MRKMMVSVIVVSMLAGCATAPPGPGQGVGAAYTPVVDMQGVDPARYEQDVAQCRAYAAQIDPAGRAAGAAVAGALFGALLSAAAGNKSYYNKQNAGVGAVLGASAGGASGLHDAKSIIMRCMAGRGYNVLG